MNLISQRKSWTKEWESGVIPFYFIKGIEVSSEKLEDYRLNKFSSLWRASIEHERMCDYLLWRGVKNDSKKQV